MRKKIFVSAIFLVGLLTLLRAQDINANVTVVASRIPSTVDHKIFTTLQNSLHDFINGRNWSNETFQNNEKIRCNFLINVASAGDNNSYSASLTVQAGRAIYNSGYTSPLINFMDESFAFRYSEYQPLDFSDNRVQ